MATELTLVRTEPSSNLRGASYARAYEVLRVLAELGPGPHPVAAINRSLDWTYSVLLRVLMTAVDSGLVDKTGRGMYELRGLVVTAAAASADPVGQTAQASVISSEARAVMSSLQQSTGELVMLHGLWMLGAPQHACVAAAVGRRSDPVAQAAESAPRTRTSRPLVYGAAGHAMLPWLPPHLANEALAARRAPRGDLWSEPLHARLDEIRESGYAASLSGEGWETIAAPLLSGTSVCGALSMTIGPAPQPGRARRGLVHKLLSAAAYVQSLLDEPQHRAAA